MDTSVKQLADVEKQKAGDVDIAGEAGCQSAVFATGYAAFGVEEWPCHSVEPTIGFQSYSRRAVITFQFCYSIKLLVIL